MTPKNGKAGASVAPAKPKKALEADIADPGKVEEIKVEQRRAQNGKYGSVKTKPHTRPKTSEERERRNSWIEIKLVDEADNPETGEEYRIILPDNSLVEGTLDEKGFARVEVIEPGT